MNPKPTFFLWGISAKKKFSKNPWDCKSFYGVGTNDYWNLDGEAKFGRRNKKSGKIRKRIDMQHFKMKKGEVDIYLDADQGIFKLCVVGIHGEEKEVYIEGLNDSGNNKGWVPHLLFAAASNNGQQVRACSIDSEYYGQKMDIQWE